MVLKKICFSYLEIMKICGQIIDEEYAPEKKTPKRLETQITENYKSTKFRTLITLITQTHTHTHTHTQKK